MILSEKESLIKKITLFLLFFLVWYLVILITVFCVIKMAGTSLSSDYLFRKQLLTIVNSVKPFDIVAKLGYFHIIIGIVSAMLAVVTVDERNE